MIIFLSYAFFFFAEAMLFFFFAQPAASMLMPLMLMLICYLLLLFSAYASLDADSAIRPFSRRQGRHHCLLMPRYFFAAMAITLPPLSLFISSLR